MVKYIENSKKQQRTQRVHRQTNPGRIQKNRQPKSIITQRNFSSNIPQQESSAKISISNLHKVNEKDIHELFAEFGPLKEVKLFGDNKNMFVAFVTFERHIDAKKGFTYHNVTLDGRPMVIEWVQHQPIKSRLGEVRKQVASNQTRRENPRKRANEGQQMNQRRNGPKSSNGDLRGPKPSGGPGAANNQKNNTQKPQGNRKPNSNRNNKKAKDNKKVVVKKEDLDAELDQYMMECDKKEE